MNTIVSVLVSMALGGLIGWLLRRQTPGAPDKRIEDELRAQVAGAKADLERATSDRLKAESARAAEEASRQAAERQCAALVAQVSTMTADLKAVHDLQSETARTLATAEANYAAATQKVAEQKQFSDEQYRSLKEADETTLTALRNELADKAADLKTLRERIDSATAALATAEANYAAATRRAAEQKQAHEEQFRSLAEAHAKALADLREAFKALSSDALKESQPEFLRLANETMAKFNEGAKGDLAQRQEAIATLVKPLEEQLKIYQQRLAQSETSQATALGEVTKHLTALAQESQTLSGETLQLRRVLGFEPGARALGRGNAAARGGGGRHEHPLRFYRAASSGRQEARSGGSPPGRPDHYRGRKGSGPRFPQRAWHGG